MLTQKVIIDKEGRYVIVEAEIDDKRIMLCNVYAPNKDSPNFFTDLFEKIMENRPENLILAGDFNFVMDESIDSIGRVTNNNKTQETLRIFNEAMLAVDVWRDLHPEEKKYTWVSKNKASRLDMIFVNYALMTGVRACEMNYAYQSDHASVFIELNVSGFQRGPGLWKFNASLLHDLNYINEINKLIDKSAPIERKDMRWEQLKAECIEFTKTFAKNKALNVRNDFKAIKMQLDQLSKSLQKEDNERVKLKLKQDIDVMNDQLHKHIEHLAAGARV